MKLRRLAVALVAAAFVAPIGAHHSFAVHFVAGDYVYPYDCDPAYGE